ncbi:TPA: hypothetical protein ACPJ2B_004550, partial [Vibrio diabolicus]
MDWSEISRFSSFIMDQRGPNKISVSKLTFQVNEGLTRIMPRIMRIILRAIPSKRFSLLAITASRIWSSRTAHPLFTLGFQQTL